MNKHGMSWLISRFNEHGACLGVPRRVNTKGGGRGSDRVGPLAVPINVGGSLCDHFEDRQALSFLKFTSDGHQSRTKELKH